ncbi:hypothetical protein BWI93_05585 [Siphonobacter sp. BAB-5385]|nr:hypothetical protein BWI93_05585 [Siphonobacter sp. BAB-5385]
MTPNEQGPVVLPDLVRFWTKSTLIRSGAKTVFVGQKCFTKMMKIRSTSARLQEIRKNWNERKVLQAFRGSWPPGRHSLPTFMSVSDATDNASCLLYWISINKLEMEGGCWKLPDGRDTFGNL